MRSDCPSVLLIPDESYLPGKGVVGASKFSTGDCVPLAYEPSSKAFEEYSKRSHK